jgi:hypothetical protein
MKRSRDFDITFLQSSIERETRQISSKKSKGVFEKENRLNPAACGTDKDRKIVDDQLI